MKARNYVFTTPSDYSGFTVESFRGGKAVHNRMKWVFARPCRVPYPKRQIALHCLSRLPMHWFAHQDRTGSRTSEDPGVTSLEVVEV